MRRGSGYTKIVTECIFALQVLQNQISCGKIWETCLHAGTHRQGWNKSNETGYKAIVEKLCPKLNAFINSTKAWRPNFQFLFSIFNVPWTPLEPFCPFAYGIRAGAECHWRPHWKYKYPLFPSPLVGNIKKRYEIIYLKIYMCFQRLAVSLPYCCCVAQAWNSLLFRAFAPCSWCSLLTEKNAICNLPRYSKSASRWRKDNLVKKMKMVYLT